MNPTTNMIIGSTVQKNIGLDKQYYSGIYEVNWNPSKYSKINFKLKMNLNKFHVIYQL